LAHRVCCLTNQANRRDDGRAAGPPRSVRVEREVRLHGYQRTLLRRAAMRVCQPGPEALHRSITSSGRRMEISFRGLAERGRPPFFTSARDKAAAVSSGSSLYSCGRMECASTLARSDFKVRREPVFFTIVSLSHAENMARSASRRIANHHHATRKQAVTDDAGLAVVFARILGSCLRKRLLRQRDRR
jgi:hypothetical protein